MIGTPKERVTIVVSDYDGSPVILQSPPWRFQGRQYGLQQLSLWNAWEGTRQDCWVHLESNRIVHRSWTYYFASQHLPGVEIMASLDVLKKAADRSTMQGAEMEVVDPKFGEEYPALYVFMASNLKPGGELRERCKVQIMAEGNAWKATLMDPQGRASIFVTLGKPQDAFKALEKALQSDNPDWRYWKDDKKKVK